MDILGFQEMLNSPHFEDDVTGIVTVLQNRIDYDGSHYPGLKYLAVSDTIVISAKPGEGRSLLRKVGQVQNALLKIGFAVRGSVAFGKSLTHQAVTGWNIFGHTFVAAYLTEQQLAIYPRVVVEKSCLDRLKDDIRATTTRETDTYILQDADGVHFVNQFASDLVGLSSKGDSRIAARKNREEFRAKIKAGLEKTEGDPRANMKWRWLERQLEGVLDS